MIQASIPTPFFLKKETQAPECQGLVFETSWRDRSFLVGVGIGGVEARKLWMSEIAQMTLGILADLPSLNKELTFAQVYSSLDVKEALATLTSGSKIMFLGAMTETLQNRILQELNVR